MPGRPKTNEEIIAALRENPAYSHIDIDRELNKATAWCMTNRRQCTPRFFVNWLNRIDPPLRPSRNEIPRSAPEQATYKCSQCFDTGEISVEVPADRRAFTHQMEFIPYPNGHQGGAR